MAACWLLLDSVIEMVALLLVGPRDDDFFKKRMCLTIFGKY